MTQRIRIKYESGENLQLSRHLDSPVGGNLFLEFALVRARVAV
jgi:hypothetical protein